MEHVCGRMGGRGENVRECGGTLGESEIRIARVRTNPKSETPRRDHTRNGECRASPRSFLTHHVANISTAIQSADAQTILNAASARMLRVSYGVM